MAKKRRKITTQSAALDETEDYQQQVPWSDLSPYVLERIYSFLCRKDQVNMSLVCRSWSEGYGTPSVWKAFDFYLSESQLLSSQRFYTKFAEKYSKFFRHVRIYCPKFSNERVYISWSRRLIYFLDILIRNSQLESVEFHTLAYCWNHVDKTKVYETIAEFLKTQRDLKMVSFTVCFFSYDEGSRIFKILAEKSGKTLKHLVIQRFFGYRTKSEQILNDLKEYPRILAFTNLTTLRTDYSLLLEFMLACNSNQIRKFVKYEKRALSKVILNYFALLDDRMPLSRRLTSDHWQILTTIFPDMQVEILILDNDMTRNMGFLILPTMPISSLLYSNYRRRNEIDIEQIFHHLLACETNEYLEKLIFKCHSEVIRGFNSFISFVQVCTKLKHLVLDLVNPIYAIDFMETLPDNQFKTLKNVHIIDTHLKRTSDYSNMQDTFCRILPHLKFNLNLVNFSRAVVRFT